jgi:hypothetical protein
MCIIGDLGVSVGPVISVLFQLNELIDDVAGDAETAQVAFTIDD